MRVTSYGLFWRADEIEWSPGRGARNAFCLYGRIGKNRGSISVCDFRYQQGIYILYNEYGSSYVGLTRKQGLGKRLKDHLSDNLENKWDRFSWFGFRQLRRENALGRFALTDAALEVAEDQSTTIGDLEALLIRAIGPRDNTAWMNFKDANEWSQVGWDETDQVLAKVMPEEK